MSWALQLVMAIVIFTAGMAGGVKFHAGLIAQRDLKQQQDNARVQILRADKVDQAAGRHEAAKTKIETVFVPITTEVERVQTIYRDRACFDDDGVRVVNRAIDAANVAAGFPARAVSSPSGTD
jgi:hypothetical protein